MNDKAEMDAKVKTWLANRKSRMATCPCGVFHGGPKNIRRHRSGCPVWKHYGTMLREEGKK